MRNKGILLHAIFCAFLLLLAACQPMDDEQDEGFVSLKQFVIESPQSYSISMSRAKESPCMWTGKNKDMEVEISESSWVNQLNSRAKSTSLSEDVEWEDYPCVGLYIQECGGDMKVKNVPINPLANYIYTHYSDKSHSGSANEVGEHISSATFFWNGWTKKANMPATANFFGLYPRPCDHTTSIWDYERNSVVNAAENKNIKKDEEDILDDDNCLTYTFWEPQTDATIKQFDLMLAKPISDSKEAGNQNETGDESIYMPFEHVFSLLEILIYKRENYTGAGVVSEISITGSEISTTGKLNIITGELTKDAGNGIIAKKIEEATLSKDVPFQTEIIVPPSSPTAKDEVGKLTLQCKIDNVNYLYDFPADFNLEKGKKYNVKLTLSPSGLSYLNVWEGATVTLDNSTDTLAWGENPVSGNQTFTVRAKEGYTISKVLKNGSEESKGEGTFNIEKNAHYNIVACKKDDWYLYPESIRIHFDAKHNTAYSDKQNKDVLVWQDITGNGNDGNLKAFNNNSNSGWNGNGLVFDGIDDIVTFPGTINPAEYTMEFYICFNKQKSTATPRLIAEGTKYPAYYLRYMSGNDNNNKPRGGKWYVGLFGHNCSQYDSWVTIDDDNTTIVQLDMVYKDNKVMFYKNGIPGDNSTRTTSVDAVPIPQVSLGNRMADNTRTTTGTYYSFILYDRALSSDEIKENLKVNIKRFGETKKK